MRGVALDTRRCSPAQRARRWRLPRQRGLRLLGRFARRSAWVAASMAGALCWGGGIGAPLLLTPRGAHLLVSARARKGKLHARHAARDRCRAPDAPFENGGPRHRDRRPSAGLEQVPGWACSLHPTPAAASQGVQWIHQVHRPAAVHAGCGPQPAARTACCGSMGSLGRCGRRGSGCGCWWSQVSRCLLAHPAPDTVPRTRLLPAAPRAVLLPCMRRRWGSYPSTQAARRVAAARSPAGAAGISSLAQCSVGAAAAAAVHSAVPSQSHCSAAAHPAVLQGPAPALAAGSGPRPGAGGPCGCQGGGGVNGGWGRGCGARGGARHPSRQQALGHWALATAAKLACLAAARQHIPRDTYVPSSAQRATRSRAPTVDSRCAAPRDRCRRCALPPPAHRYVALATSKTCHFFGPPPPLPLG